METNESHTTPGTADISDDTASFPDDGLNERQRKFADLYLSGQFGNRAAILAGYSEENAARIATRLLKIPAVAAYIAEQKKRLAEESFYHRRLFSDWLWKVIITSVDEAAEGDNIIQEQTIRESPDGTTTRRIKMVSKLAAMRQLARMYDCDLPERNLPPKLAAMFQGFRW